MTIKRKTHWWTDAILFTGFLLAFFLSFTGIELHQWIGTFGALLAGFHFVAHLDWVKAVSKKLCMKTNSVVQFKYLLDAALLVGFVFITMTGLAFPPGLTLLLRITTGGSFYM